MGMAQGESGRERTFTRRDMIENEGKVLDGAKPWMALKVKARGVCAGYTAGRLWRGVVCEEGEFGSRVPNISEAGLNVTMKGRRGEKCSTQSGRFTPVWLEGFLRTFIINGLQDKEGVRGGR